MTESAAKPQTSSGRGLPPPEVVPRAERRPRISVIIPVRNEADILPALLRSLVGAGVHEVIVVDGQSDDESVERARQSGATVLSCAPSRGRQLSLGAEAASGEVILFLHADSILPPGFADQILRIAQEPGVVAGAFRFEIDAVGVVYRVIERLVQFRSRWLGWPYGDQAIFLTRASYDAVGGIASIPAMEDYDLVRRLRRRGRIVLAPTAVRTSPRRWQRDGVIRTTVLNLWCVLATMFGVGPERIARWRGQATDTKIPPSHRGR